MRYRAEIDGLRTLAVIPVILYHLNFQLFRGGYVGVDIFFVISGYLISTIIFEELENKKFNLVNFYERRTRRILPALLFTLIISVFFSWILLQPYEFIKFHKSLFSVLTFSSNIFFLRDGDYFFTDSNLKPLLHTWSLAVEEQFYLFFPLLLLLIHKLKRKIIFFILLFITITSLIICSIGSVYFQTFNFYLLPSRFWELSIGSIIALKIDALKNLSNSKRNELFGIAGLALILFSIFFFNEHTPFPSLFTLLPTFGAALIITFVSSEQKVGRVLSNKIFVTLGLLSYSAYLFHQPIISFFKIYTERDLLFLQKILILGLTFISSYFSYCFIELKFKNKIVFSRERIFSLAICTSLCLIIYSIFIFKFVNFQYEKDLAFQLSRSKVIIATNMDERKFTKSRIDYLTKKPDILLLGSSRIMQVSSSPKLGNVLNLSVSGASVEDLITFSVLALEKFTPKVIYLAADPWLFNENSNQDRWLSVKDEFEYALRVISNTSSFKYSINNSTQIQNPFFFELYKSVNVFYSKHINMDEKSGIYDKIRNDGSRIYNSTYSNLNLIEKRKGFQDIIKYSMQNFKFSKKNYDNFSKLIDYIKNKKIKIFLVLSPYHPELYAKIKSEKSQFLISESIFNSMANEKSIEIIGSYNPEKCSCSEIDFFDGMHPKDSCINNIILRNLK